MSFEFFGDPPRRVLWVLRTKIGGISYTFGLDWGTLIESLQRKPNFWNVHFRLNFVSNQIRDRAMILRRKIPKMTQNIRKSYTFMRFLSAHVKYLIHFELSFFIFALKPSMNKGEIIFVVELQFVVKSMSFFLSLNKNPRFKNREAGMGASFSLAQILIDVSCLLNKKIYSTYFITCNKACIKTNLFRIERWFSFVVSLFNQTRS